MSEPIVVEILVDTQGDGFTAPTTEVGAPARIAGQFANFLSCLVDPGDRVRLPVVEGDADPASMAVAMWLTPQNDSTVALTNPLAHIEWSVAGTQNIQCVYDRVAARWEARRDDGGALTDATQADTYSAGDPKFVVFNFGATTIGVSVDGAALSEAANAGAPVLSAAAFDVGSVGGASNHSESAYGAVAVFDRPLSQLEINYFAALTRPPMFGEHVERSMTHLWYGENTEYFETKDDNVRPDAEQAAWRRGRDYPSQLTGRSSAGVFDMRVDNKGGRYTPGNAASPLFRLLQPGRRIRVRIASTTQHYDRWSGTLDRAPRPEHLGFGNWAVIMSGSGVLADVQAAGNLSTTGETDITTGAALCLVLDEAGISAADRVLDTGQETLPVWFGDGFVALEAARQIEDSEGPGAFIYEDGKGRVVFEDRHHRLTSPHDVSERTFSTDVGATLPIGNVVPIEPEGEIYNRVTVNVRPTETSGGATDVLWTNAADDPVIAPGETKTFIAKWPTPITIGGAYVDGWVTPDVTDIVPSGVSFGDLGIVTTKRAREMEMAITNNGAADATITTLRGRGQARNWSDLTQQIAEDLTSQGIFGVRDFPFEPVWLQNLNVANDWANAIKSRHANPITLVALTLRTNRDAAMLTGVLESKISDRITIDANIVELGLDSFEAFVESISDRLMPDGLETTLECSEASVSAPWWVFTASLGVDTGLGY